MHNLRCKQTSVKSFRLLALTVLKCIAPQIRRNIEKWEEYGTRCKSENLLTYCQKFKCETFRVVAIYQPPKRNHAVFEEEFDSFLEETCIGNIPVSFSGDLNIHYNDPSHPLTQIYIELLTAFNLTQHFNEPTHEKGHILHH